MNQEVIYLLKKEMLLEFRQRYAFMGIILFVLSTIFVCYLSMRTIEDSNTWNALLWIIILFTAFNAIGKSFSNETRGLHLYLYTLVSPEAVILSKIIYNAGVMGVLSVLSLLFYMLFLGTDTLVDASIPQFVLGIFIGSVGLSSVLTMVSGIASKTNNNVGIMAVLGFPVIIPLIVVMMDFSNNSIDGMPWSENYQNLAFLGVIIGAVSVLSYVLFPYLWRD